MKHTRICLILSLVLRMSESILFPTICLKSDKCLQGVFMKGFRSQENFQAYMGIPYAMPPVDELRFKNPEPYMEWTGTLDASVSGPQCLQKNYLVRTPLVGGKEDCLYLNVYRPDGENVKNLPVMVYIHGGGLFTGTVHHSVHGPEYFMDTKEVILVTFAYRLGVFGFLSTGDEHIEGNFGLKDQTTALKWVQENIAAFGGDPNSVTIFGQSAGGSAVHLHMLSKASKGLFHKAIVMSGMATAAFITPIQNPKEQAVKIAKSCNIANAQNYSSEELANKLRSVSAMKLVNAGDSLKYWDVDPLINFRPVIESSNNPDAFLTADPEEIISSGNYTHVPWMTGLVPNEGAVRLLTLYENNPKILTFNQRFDELFEGIFEFPGNNLESNRNKSNRVIDSYLGGKHKLDNTTFDGFMNAITDRAFVHPYYQNIKKHVEHAKSPVFLYKFNYRGLNSYSLLYSLSFKNYGVVHCDDLVYLFKSPLFFPQPIDLKSTDATVIHEFVDTFVEFVKTGKPKRSENIKPCTQEAFENGNNTICDYIEFKNKDDSVEIQINNKFNVGAVNFWNDLLEPASAN